MTCREAMMRWRRVRWSLVEDTMLYLGLQVAVTKKCVIFPIAIPISSCLQTMERLEVEDVGRGSG